MNPNSHFLSLKLIQKCPACETQFQQATVAILEETEFSILAHLHCHNCQVNLLAQVTMMPQGMIGNAVLIDQTAEEVIAGLGAPTLSDNDFLNLYQQTNNKNFISIINDMAASSPIELKKE